MLAPAAHVLDLGCGSGVPARFLLDRGFALTGVDGSLELLKLARGRCPEARLVAADLVALPVRARYRGAVAWDSFFHVERALHEQLFRDVADLLEPGSPFLVSLGGSGGDDDDDGDGFTAPMFGVDFFYSSWAPERSVELLEECGFRVIACEVDDPSSRGHIAVLCERVRGSA